MSLLALNGFPQSCPSHAYGDDSNTTYSVDSGETTAPDFRLPLHVDVSDLSSVNAVRHVLGLYDGSSSLVNANKRLDTGRIPFSRVGGILAGAS